MDYIDKIIAYECGMLDGAGMVYLFAELIKDGSAWSLQGHYGRTAKLLIDRGIIMPNGDIDEMSDVEANENTKEIDIDFMQKRYFVNYHIDNKKNIEITSVSSAGQDLDYEEFGDSLKKIILEEIISDNDDYASGGEE